MPDSDSEFKMVEPKSAMAEAEISKQMTEIQSQITIAKKFPRDLNQVYTNLMTACKRSGLANKALWAYPRGGKAIAGPGIRLAEVAAQCYGNLDYGIREIEQKPGESVMQSYCYDLETNVRSAKIYTVKHEKWANGKIKKLFDPRDIYEHTANLSTRRLRACILGVLPGDLIDAAAKQCKLTAIGKSDEPLEDKVKKMVLAFDKYAVSQEMIETYLKHPVADMDAEEVFEMRTIYESIKDGNAKRKDFFKISREESQKEAAESDKETSDITDAEVEPITFKEQPKRQSQYAEVSKMQVSMDDIPGLTPPEVDKSVDKEDKGPPTGNPI